MLEDVAAYGYRLEWLKAQGRCTSCEGTGDNAFTGGSGKCIECDGSGKYEDEQRLLAIARLAELLDKRLQDDDYFEEDEFRPSPATVELAKATIAALRTEDASADVGFFWGEIHIEWENEADDRKVKVFVTRPHAALAGASASEPEIKIYFGRMENNRVVESGVISGSTEALVERLDWMRSDV